MLAKARALSIYEICFIRAMRCIQAYARRQSALDYSASRQRTTTILRVVGDNRTSEFATSARVTVPDSFIQHHTERGRCFERAENHRWKRM